MKYFLLLLIMTSCSLNKNSTFWNEDLKKNSTNNKKISVISTKNVDFNSMTFDEFALYLEDYSNKTDYPNIDN